MQGLGIEARGKSLARGMGWGQEYGLGIKGWKPWVRTMAGNKGQGLRVGHGLGWDQGYGVGSRVWGGDQEVGPWVRAMAGDKGQG